MMKNFAIFKKLSDYNNTKQFINDLHDFLFVFCFVFLMREQSKVLK